MPITDLEKYRVIDNINSYYRIKSESKRELLLNKYPNAAAAYSLRLLDGYYRGPLVRVRRDDGVEVDVYPDYNNELSLDSLVSNVDVHTTNDSIPDADYAFQLSLNSLGEFIGATGYSSTVLASDATVCVWYDQANIDNGNDAIQDTLTNQPLIVSNGVIIEENGKPALDFDGTDDYLTAAMSATDIISTNAENTVAAVLNQDSASADNRLASNESADPNWALFTDQNGQIAYNGGNNSTNRIQQNTPANWEDNQHLIFFSCSLTYQQIAIDGTVLVSNSSQVTLGGSSTVLQIGKQYSIYQQGTVQEFVLYNTDESSNRIGIEEDINDYYQIEGFEAPQPLLDEFGGAAAAYSLRLLSSTYSGPLVRIRRDIDDIEVDVYPDSNGEFSKYSTIKDGGAELTTGVTGGTTDKTTLHEFLYGVETNCFVVRWYDQSSDNPANGNHATQDIETAQPKIYDGSTGVVTENGKPAIDFDGSNHRFALDTSSFDVGSLSSFAIGKMDTITGQQIMLSLSGTSGGKRWYSPYVYLGDFNYAYENTVTAVSATANTNTNLHTMMAGSTLGQMQAWLNSLSVGTLTLTTGIDSTQNGIMNFGSAFHADGKMQEVIIYDSDQSANRTGIETNINDYYNIY